MPGEYYDRLGVSSDASTDEIAAAYRERLKETHPDVSDAADAGERTKRLIEAKAVLTDERERGRYDRLGHNRYVRTEEGRTPEAEGTTQEGDERGECDDRETSSTGADSRTSAGETARKDAASGSGSTNDGGAAGHETGGSGTHARRGVDWGTHTAREGRARHRDGVNWEERAETDWEEWAETDWDAVSEAVWEDVTGDDSGQSRHTATGQGTATDSRGAGADSTADHRATDTRVSGSTGQTRSGEHDPAGWSATGSAGQERVGAPGRESTAGSDPSSTAGGAGAAGAPGDTAGVGTTTATGTAPGAPGTGAASNASAGTADRGDWTVGWYNGGDPSGASHDTYSFGASDTSRGLWSNWSPGLEHHGRYSRRTFPPHRILSPVQTVVLFCLCFVTYPLLVTGAVFPILSSPVRLGLAVFLVFVVATLIILSRLGMAIFGGWTVLFPLAFEHFGVSMFTQESLLTMGAVLFSLGLALLSRMVTRPRAL